MRNVIAIVQARMGASRLPNKMMLHLHGYPVIEWIYRRASRARRIDSLVFALPATHKDGVLALYLKKLGAQVFLGSEDDVLDRFYCAAKDSSASHIVRICADNPLVSPFEIDNLVDYYFSNPCDYAYNHVPKANRYPDGLGAEILSFPLLERLHREAVEPGEREHVFNYIWDNQHSFVIKTFDPPDAELAFPALKLDLDTYDDYCHLLEADIAPEMDDRELVAVFNSKIARNI